MSKLKKNSQPQFKDILNSYNNASKVLIASEKSYTIIAKNKSVLLTCKLTL